MNHILNEKLIAYILKNYDGHINKNSISSKNLKQIYNIILNAYNETKKIKYSLETVPIHSQEDMIYPTSFSGKFLPEEIKQYNPAFDSKHLFTTNPLTYSGISLKVKAPFSS